MDFRQKVVYQIYPKSFKDSNGDGIGDLNGIIEKLPHLANLGVDVIWFSPFFPSPQKDNGYDVSDYCAINPIYGTMEDFRRLVKSMKAYGMEMMLDMVLNHTSTEHEWFQKALAGDKYYQDFYILREGQLDGSLPTNWESKFGGPAWEKFGALDNTYYLHLYDRTQADLDWRNPNVRKELAAVVNFWINEGVSGFRFDVINVIGKDEDLIDAADGVGKELYTDRPIVHDYLRELNQRTFGKIDSLTVGEMSATTVENCILYTNPTNNELSMTFNFHHLKVDYVDGEKWSIGPVNFNELKALLHKWNTEMAKGGGWNAWFWNNHDQPRALARFGNDKEYREETAKMLATVVHLNRGTPYIYQGEEIGMTDPYFDKLSDYRDVESLNAYSKLRELNYSDAEALAIVQSKSRDNSRTPIPWSNKQESAGFTTGKPWIAINDDWQKINVETEVAEGSIFPYYQKLIKLRKQYPVIAFGDYLPELIEYPEVYAFRRKHEQAELLVISNFSSKDTIIKLSEDWHSATKLIGNYNTENIGLEYRLEPYEVLALIKDI